jgi:hypothetical protein
MSSPFEYLPETVPSEVRVLVDTREKKPLIFPSFIDYYTDRTPRSGTRIRIIPIHTRLDVGDYQLEPLKGAPTAVIECKRSFSEISNNLTSDYNRATAAFDKLTKIPHRYLFLQDTLSGMSSPFENWPIPHTSNPDMVMDAFLREITKRNIHLIWIGKSFAVSSLRCAGALAVRILLHHELNPNCT